MIQLFSNPLFVLPVSFALAVAVTYLVRRLAWRYGFVAKPKSDRWHNRPTAMMGGVAIFLTTVVMYLLFVPYTREAWVILAGSTFLFLIGLIDDVIHIKPYQKLIGQLIGTAFVVGFGLVLPWTGSEILNIAITAFWLIGVTNAINLLDNMDGLAAGISAIAASVLAITLLLSGQPSEMTLILVFIGALLGFLVYNFNPASIFMGDCGSMFVGFFLASSVLLNELGGRSRTIISVLAIPALILFVPIFDTTFVTILRKIRGRKASQGGRDHTSHRLVALGLSERSAVLMLFGFAIIAGAISILVRELHSTQALALIAAFIMVLTMLGVYLSKVKVYGEQDAELAVRNNAAYAFLINLSYKRRIFEVGLDAVLVALSYYAAYVLIFGAFEDTATWALFVKSLPILIVVKLFSFLAAGVYRGIWRYTSIRDFFTFLKGNVLGSSLSVMAILLVYRFQYYSRAVFILDGLILFAGVAGSRIMFRLLRQLFPLPASGDNVRALIYGAGDGGELVLRELKNNPAWNYQPVGFVDDDPMKKGNVIHGLKVFGGNGILESTCRDQDIQEVLISFREVPPEKLKELRNICNDVDVSLKRALLKIEPVDFE